MNSPKAESSSSATAAPYAYRKLAVSGADFEALRDLIDVLLQADGGCPWDKEQTLASLCQLFPMEVAEVREAVQNGDRAQIFEELGDCLMLLLLLLAKAQNLPPDAGGAAPWDAAKALELVREKIVRRHTWIFGADKAASPADVEKLWELNKRREKSAGSDGGAAGGRP